MWQNSVASGVNAGVNTLKNYALSEKANFLGAVEAISLMVLFDLKNSCAIGRIRNSIRAVFSLYSKKA